MSKEIMPLMAKANKIPTGPSTLPEMVVMFHRIIMAEVGRHTVTQEQLILRTLVVV